MKSRPNKESNEEIATNEEQNPEFQKNLKFMNDLCGDEVGLEKIKYLLRGADGNVEVALNHLLNDLEKEDSADLERSVAESPNLSERMERILSDLAEEVKCPLCLAYFNSPVVLNCLHTFCSPCLETLVSEQTQIECPLCRTISSLDDTGVKGLKYNHYLANIVEKLKLAQNTRMCAECSSYLCTVFCKQCKAFLCTNCNEKIHSIRLLYGHCRVPFEDCFFSTPKPSISPTRRGRKDSIVDSESDVVIPFNVKKEVCIDLWNTWLKTIWFAPTDFEKTCVLQEFTAIYMPYWLFEVEAISRYNGTVGYSDRIVGRTEFEMKTPAFGVSSKIFNDIMVCASDTEEADLLHHIQPWKMDQIQRFTLKHSESTEVRAFSLSSEQAWNRAKASLDQRSRVECEKELRLGRLVDKVRDLSIDTNYTQRKAKRLFVPIYVTTCEYGGRSFTFIVNGSTAKVYGQRPYSPSKLASLSFTGIGAAIGILTGARLRGS